MKNSIRLVAILFAITAGHSGLAQSGEPKLAAIKAAAEKGDAMAQDQLGDAYRARMDYPTALDWYRKAAEQGVAHSQSELGRILISYAKSPMAKPDVSVMHADEAIKCYHLAANQGDRAAQFGLGQQFEEGRFIKQDYVEAYKWYDLAARDSGMLDFSALGAKPARDALILKMSQEQVAEGRKRVAAFVPRRISTQDLPEPAWVKEIKLQGLSGVAPRRLAVISGQTFQKGDRQRVKAGGKSVEVHCLEVGPSSVTVAIEGLAQQRELKLVTE